MLQSLPVHHDQPGMPALRRDEFARPMSFGFCAGLPADTT
jgi:hypothetical protein